MKTAFRSFGVLFAVVILACMALGNANAAVYQVYSSRVITTAGATGLPLCTATGATNATPTVVTCSQNPTGFVNGDQVQGTGFVGSTGANTLAYVSVSGATLALYSNSAFTNGITGTGASKARPRRRHLSVSVQNSNVCR
jgi:hypothetical protein